MKNWFLPILAIVGIIFAFTSGAFQKLFSGLGDWLGGLGEKLGLGGDKQNGQEAQPKAENASYSPSQGQQPTLQNAAYIQPSYTPASKLLAPQGETNIILLDVGHSGYIEYKGKRLSDDQLNALTGKKLKEGLADGSMKIVATEPGAISAFDDKKTEFEHNVVQAYMTKDKLVAKGMTVEMYISTSDSLEARVDRANQVNAATFISFHNNAGGGRGSEIFFADGHSSSAALAKSMNAANVKQGLPTRGAKNENQIKGLGVFNGHNNTNRQLVLAEGFFMDNKADNDLGNTEKFRQQYTDSIVASVESQLLARGFKRDTTVPNVPETSIANLPSPQTPNVAKPGAQVQTTLS